jgi:hypothetical protein
MKLSEIVNNEAEKEFNKIIDELYEQDKQDRADFKREHPIKYRLGLYPYITYSKEFYNRKYKWIYRYAFRDGVIWAKENLKNETN